MSNEKKTAEEQLKEKEAEDPKAMAKLDKEIAKAEGKTEPKKEKAEKVEKPKIEVFCKDLKEAIKSSKIGDLIKWTPRAKRIALKFKGVAVFYIHDSTQGIHHFKRSRGTRLESGYLVTKAQMTEFVTLLSKEVLELKAKHDAEQKEVTDKKEE